MSEKDFFSGGWVVVVVVAAGMYSFCLVKKIGKGEALILATRPSRSPQRRPFYRYRFLVIRTASYLGFFHLAQGYHPWVVWIRDLYDTQPSRVIPVGVIYLVIRAIEHVVVMRRVFLIRSAVAVYRTGTTLVPALRDPAVARASKLTTHLSVFATQLIGVRVRTLIVFVVFMGIA